MYLTDILHGLAIKPLMLIHNYGCLSKVSTYNIISLKILPRMVFVVSVLSCADKEEGLVSTVNSQMANSCVSTP